MERYSIGIDLGGTKTESVLLRDGSQEIFRRRISTPAIDGYEAIVETTAELIRETRKRLPDDAKLSGVGIGIPGMSDPESGLIRNANTTCLIGRPFRADLEERLQLPVYLENDANCFTLAECRLGAARGRECVFGVIMGTGCGGGILIGNAIHTGLNGIAGEWGHMAIDPRGVPCYCGKRGCVETKISGPGVEAAYRRSAGVSSPALTMPEIVTGYREGKTICREIMEQFLDDFGRALGAVLSLLDPDLVVIGGGLSNIDEIYTIGLERVRYHTFHEKPITPIVKNQLGDSAGVLGAAWLSP